MELVPESDLFLMRTIKRPPQDLTQNTSLAVDGLKLSATIIGTTPSLTPNFWELADEEWNTFISIDRSEEVQVLPDDDPKGLASALKQIGIGEKLEVIVPAHKGYEHGFGDKVKEGDALVYRIEVHEFYNDHHDEAKRMRKPCQLNHPQTCGALREFIENMTSQTLDEWHKQVSALKKKKRITQQESARKIVQNHLTWWTSLLGHYPHGYKYEL